MDIIERIVSEPDNMEPLTEQLPWGAVLRVWRCSKLTSGHGAQDTRVAVPTGGLEFEVTFPAPRYGPARPITSRMRPGWTPITARTRYVHILERSLDETLLNTARDRLLSVFEYYRMSGLYERLVQHAEEHGLHLDVEDMAWPMVHAWERLLHIPLDNDSQVS